MDIELVESSVLHLIRDTVSSGSSARGISKVPWDKLSQLVGGVLTPLSRDGAYIVLQVEIDAQSKSGIRRETVDLKILETVKR